MSRGSSESGWTQGLPVGEDQRPLVGAWSVRGAETERMGFRCSRARHRDTGQAAELCTVASAEETESARRLEQAGELAARLVHPNLMRVYECGVAQQLRFVAVEARSGETLAQRVTARGKMGLDEALRWLEECTRGLAAAHNAGLIHGAIDPARIALVPKGEAKIDGLYAGLRRESAPLASTSRGAGDPAFAAPEQRGSNKKAELTPAADLYALTCCFVYAVSGKPLALGKDGSAPRLDRLFAGAPERLVELVARCLRRDAGERPVDASALIGALDSALRGEAEEDASLQAEWDEEMSWAAGEKKRAAKAALAAGKKGGKAAKGAKAAPPRAAAARVAVDPALPPFDESMFGDDEKELELPETRRTAKANAWKRWVTVLIAAAVLISVLLVALPSGRSVMRSWFGGEKSEKLVPPRAESTAQLYERAEAAMTDPLRLGQAEHLLSLVVAREPRHPQAQSKLATTRAALARQSAQKGQWFEALRWSAQAVEAGLAPTDLESELDQWKAAGREELLRALLLERCEWNRDGSRVRLSGRLAHPALRRLSYGGQTMQRDPQGRFDLELVVRSSQDGIRLEAEHGIEATRAMPAQTR
ncbi:MAG: hypothetical protein IPN34_06520 [Planctomycetes bacterium]|nr:hypothetical protein [Planctomycetota bacterium]